VAENPEQPLVDGRGRYVVTRFDHRRPFADAMNSVAGPKGKNLWAYFNNRCQGVASFGSNSSNGAILQHEDAASSFRHSCLDGFRTMVNGYRSHADGEIEEFHFQPFLDDDLGSYTCSWSDPGAKPTERNMFIGESELEVEEWNYKVGVKTNILYSLVTEESFPGMVRRVSFANLLNTAVEMEVLDGLARVVPAGVCVDDVVRRANINAGREVVGNAVSTSGDDDDADDDEKDGMRYLEPFYSVGDAAGPINFAVAYLEEQAAEGQELAAKDSKAVHSAELLPFVVDPTVVFDWDSTAADPMGFFRDLHHNQLGSADGTDAARIVHVGDPSGGWAGATLGVRGPLAHTTSAERRRYFDALLSQSQQNQGSDQAASGLAGATVSLAASDTKGYTDSPSIVSVYGRASSRRHYHTHIQPVVLRRGFAARQRVAASQALRQISTAGESLTSNPVLDRYVAQSLVDTELRGGLGMVVGDADADADGENDATTMNVVYVYGRAAEGLERDGPFRVESLEFSQYAGRFGEIFRARRADMATNPATMEHNIQLFLSLIQADGYHPSVVYPTRYVVSSSDALETTLTNLVNVMVTGSNSDADVVLYHRRLRGWLRRQSGFTVTEFFSAVEAEGLDFPPGQQTAVIAQLLQYTNTLPNSISTAAAADAEDDHCVHLDCTASPGPASTIAEASIESDDWWLVTDLLESYLSVYPDKITQLLFDAHVPFVMSRAIVLPRSQRYTVEKSISGGDDDFGDDDADGAGIRYRLRVRRSVSVEGDRDYPASRRHLMDTIAPAGTGAAFQLTTSSIGNGDSDSSSVGEVLRVTVAAKLFMLLTLRFASMDMQGLGVEMDGRMQGGNAPVDLEEDESVIVRQELAALLGSSVSETYELLRGLRLLKVMLQQTGEAEEEDSHVRVHIPQEFSRFSGNIRRELIALLKEYGSPAVTTSTPGEYIKAGVEEDVSEYEYSKRTEFHYWDRVHVEKEAYRSQVTEVFSGKMVSVSATDAMAMLDLMIMKVNSGIYQSLRDESHHLSPTYFYYDCTDFHLEDATPTAAPTAQPTVPGTYRPSKQPTASPTKRTHTPTAARTKKPTHRPTASPSSAETSAETNAETSAETSASDTSHHNDGGDGSGSGGLSLSLDDSGSNTNLNSAINVNINIISPKNPDPTGAPTGAPTSIPTTAPTAVPTVAPTPAPSDQPTAAPSTKATPLPSQKPHSAPTGTDTGAKTETETETETDSSDSDDDEIQVKIGGVEVALVDKNHPIIGADTAATEAPSARPSKAPVVAPTQSPTRRPHAAPTQRPTHRPSVHVPKEDNAESAWEAEAARLDIAFAHNEHHRPTFRPTRRPVAAAADTNTGAGAGAEANGGEAVDEVVEGVVGNLLGAGQRALSNSHGSSDSDRHRAEKKLTVELLAEAELQQHEFVQVFLLSSGVRRTVPLFLDGVVAHLSALSQTPSGSSGFTTSAVSIVNYLKGSDLYDKPLKMFRVSESLERAELVPPSAPVWMRHQPISLPMQYRLFGELLKNGLYAQFYDTIRSGLVPLMDFGVYGRPTMESAAAIVSSAAPNFRTHGRGLRAHDADTSAEFLRMWQLMTVAGAGAEAGTNTHTTFSRSRAIGAANGPFYFQSPAAADDQSSNQLKLVFGLQPVLADWMFADVTNTVQCRLLGRTKITYYNPSRQHSWELKPTYYEVTMAAGVIVPGATHSSGDGSIPNAVLVPMLDENKEDGDSDTDTNTPAPAVYNVYASEITGDLAHAIRDGDATSIYVILG